MPKRLARYPSIRSLKPAARNRAKAIRISPDVIAHRITGTARMRASVIRLGMLKPSPRLEHVPPELSHFGQAVRMWLDLSETSTEMHRSLRFDTAHPLNIAARKPLHRARMCRTT